MDRNILLRTLSSTQTVHEHAETINSDQPTDHMTGSFCIVSKLMFEHKKQSRHHDRNSQRHSCLEINLIKKAVWFMLANPLWRFLFD